MSPIQISCGSNALIEPTGSNGFYYFFADAAGNLLLDSGTSFQTNAINGDTLFFFAAADVPPNQTFTFTNCGASGRIGPTQVEADAAYGATNLDGLVNILGSGIQEWTVPATGTYIIEAYGAQGGAAGGGSGGKGAKVVGEFQLTAGQKLHVIVGQKGGSYETTSNRFQSSGGGGSFVVFENASDENDILVIAGGGGGFAFNRTTNNVDGQIGAAGGNGSGFSSSSNGGTNGNGGASGSGGTYGGGGGFSGNGATGTTRGGRSFLNGGEGGTGTISDTEGGFGGGGGVTRTTTTNRRYAGGGGGYSGGGAAHSTSTGTGATAGAAGGGGGSYNNGANQVLEAGVQEDDGLVVITYVPTACLSNILQVNIEVEDLQAPDAIPTLNLLCGEEAVIEPTGGTGTYAFFSDSNGENLLGSGSSFTTGNLSNDTIFYVASVTSSVSGILGETFEFTNGGASGRIGPNQSQVDASYAGTNLENQVTVSGSGVQVWEVPHDGIYFIEALGAQGGAAGGGEGGKGALISGEFFLSAGQKLHIVVGQEGRSSSANTRRWQASGGGGSFVVFEDATDDNDILVIAGGGGGFALDQSPNNADGQAGNNGGDGLGGSSGAAGGSAGSGGASGAGATYGGGGGFSGSGTTETSRGGRSFLSGGEGGTGSGTPPLEGGFGGGGGVSAIATNDRRYAGGGGGYSGGGAAHSILNTTLATSGAAGGGGGSYNNGNNPINLAGVNEGNGRVRIKFIQPPCVSALTPVQITVDELPEPDAIPVIDSQCGSTAEIVPTGSTDYYLFSTDAAGLNLVGIGSSFTTGTLFDDTTLYVAAVPASLPLSVIDTFVFTNAGKTGLSGPNQSEINAAYTNTNLDGLVTVNEPGIQEWVVPVSGMYKIKAAGASGAEIGGSGEPGLGAVMEGVFFLQEGQVIDIVVGQEGTTTSTNGGGGGGGSFVVFNGATADEHILLIAGGGGTCVAKSNDGIAHGKIANNGSDGERSTGVYAGGFDGLGGEGQQNIAGAGGGFGGLSSCSGHPGEPNCGDAFNTTTNSDNNRGAGFVSTGLTHGERARGGSSFGGFGGGGGANTASLGRVGGGGGYSGGGGGFNGNGNPSCSGGGGSYNAGFNQSN